MARQQPRVSFWRRLFLYGGDIPKRQVAVYDKLLIWVVILLLSFGLVMVYSSSIANAALRLHDAQYFLKRQAVFIVMGLAIGFFIVKWVSIDLLSRNARANFVFSLLLLVAVLVLARDINGARRWIAVAGFNVQPSEYFKLSVVLYLASYFERYSESILNVRRIIYAGIFIAIGLWLLIQEPDLGGAIVVSLVVVGMFLLAGISFRWLLSLLFIGGLFASVLVLFVPWRFKRVVNFLDPWQDANGTGYQLINSLLGISQGGWFGQGLGGSVEKLAYLPEAHTDFILAIIAEELGTFGVALLAFGYVWLVMRAFRIGYLAEYYGRLSASFIAKGIGLWLGLQSAFNLAVSHGLLPTKGLTLPFISYGGSSLIMMMICMALLIRIDYENGAYQRGEHHKEA